ncbi:MAG: ribonuclease R [Burkholderiales bacterium]
MSKKIPPSRPPLADADLLAELVDAGVPLDRDELAVRLRVRPRDRAQVDAAIARLHDRGAVLVNRKGQVLVAARLDLVVGRLEGHPDGYGFLEPDAGGPDIALPAREMHKALHGDRASVRVTGTDRRGRPEGEIVEVLERVNREVVGRLHEERGVWFVVAENRRINQDLLVPAGDRGAAKAGDVVVAEIVEPPTADREPIARVSEVLGRATDPGIEIEIALRKHALPFVFSKAALAQAKRLPDHVLPRERAGREDLTALPLVTIDGETAKDFDDAVWCERKGKGFRLIVAIADVSHYVADGDAIDRDARERGTSVYFPRRVIPMLPEALSNELCSLKPAVDRLAMVADIDIAATGAIRRYRFYEAVIHSRARLTYTEVWNWLSDPAAAAGDDRAAALMPHLRALEALWRALASARAKRGAIDFETVELSLEFDARGKIERIVPSPRNDAHRLIEECMLAANVCAADLLAEAGHPALYRVHEGPTPEKLEQLKAFLAASALALPGGENPTALDYARLLDAIRQRPDFALLQTVLLRSLQQAQYRPDNVGHFGLAYEAYTHFTSPIRRYPDLLVHRAIKAALAGRRYQPAGAGWAELGVATSMTERRADDASRDVEAWLKCYYMQDKVGETFDGTVSGVASFGVFVTLDGLNVDGLVHVTDLPRDYFRFDAARHALAGERSGRVFRLADRLRVCVARVDLDQSRVDFTLADEGPPRRAPVSQPLARDGRAAPKPRGRGRA